MKKVLLIISLIIVFLTLLNYFPTKQKIEERNEKTMNNKYTFYKIELENRYENYKIKNPNLKQEDIIIRVNLNLDKPFYTDIKPAKYLNTSSVLVNKYNYLEETYVPKNLEEITECTQGERLLVKEANDNLKKLCEASKNENLQLRVISSYRSYTYQKNLYDKYVSIDGIEKADTYSARPGFSEHQTGLVIDVDNIETGYENFENTKEFKWMQENAYKYGFILRYPRGKEDITGYNYEAWHYRYVGKEIAKIIQEQGITFDEYYVKYIDN